MAMRVVILALSVSVLAAQGSDPVAQARSYLAEFDAACADTQNQFWGISLCGPTLLVDVETRAVVANRQDAGGVLKPADGAFVGTWPPTEGIANTAIDWSGTRWTMLMTQSINPSRPARTRLMAHEAFHRIQPLLGITTGGAACEHLDDEAARYWLQLEWNALDAALRGAGDARAAAIGDALTFRAARRARFDGAAATENSLEVFEGLAEYTGMRFARHSPAELLDVIANIRKSDRGFVRSFAYVSGPLYGYLLDGASDDWRKRVSATTDLGLELGRASGAAARPADAEGRAVKYDGQALRQKEAARAERRAEQMRDWRRLLVDGPVLILDLRAVTSGSFNPYEVYPFAPNRTVYTTRELIAEWGVLQVSAGAVLEDRETGRAFVSITGAAPDGLSGPGWTLRINPGWQIRPGERPGDRVLAKAALRPLRKQ